MKTKWWLFGLRVGLGIVFIVASISKLPLQSQFINEVAGYGLLPPTMARIYGLALPWVELAAGCSLILGIFTTLALVFSILMTVSFIVANIYALYQGVGESCGCFGQLIPLSHTTSLITDILMILTVVVLLLLHNKMTLMRYVNNRAYSEGIEQIFLICERDHPLLTCLKGFIHIDTMMQLYIKPWCEGLLLSGKPVFKNGLDL
ncbi:DoxX family protein [Chloroflexota bacterium]